MLGGEAQGSAFLGFVLRDSFVLTGQPYLFYLNDQAPRHTIVAGGSGSGKTVDEIHVMNADRSAMVDLKMPSSQPDGSWSPACSSLASLSVGWTTPRHTYRAHRPFQRFLASEGYELTDSALTESPDLLPPAGRDQSRYLRQDAVASTPDFNDIPA